MAAVSHLGLISNPFGVLTMRLIPRFAAPAVCLVLAAATIGCGQTEPGPSSTPPGGEMGKMSGPMGKMEPGKETGKMDGPMGKMEGPAGKMEPPK